MVASSNNQAEETIQDPIPLPRGPGDLLPLSYPGWEKFQKFCRDLLKREPDIKSCDIFGKSGQRQHGIDIKAIREDGGCEVGQCKCKEDIYPHEIEKASIEFLKHWDYWEERDVRRFILFLACETEKTQLHEQIEKETKRFSEKGIKYEPWNQVCITEKARGNPDLVTTYFTSLWAGRIRATWVGSSDVGQAKQDAIRIIDTSVVSTLGQVSHEAVSDQVRNIRSLWNRGRVGKAQEKIAYLKSSANWPVASPTDRAIALRIESGLLLAATVDQLDKAIALANEAHSLDPEADQRALRALIAHARSGPEAALQELDGPETLKILNLQAQLDLELGNFESTEEILNGIEARFTPDAATHRTEALLMLSKRDIDSAFLAISEAAELAPDSAAVRFAEATIAFWSSVSPAVFPSRLLAAPLPIDWRFVKQDDATLERLVLASNNLANLMKSAGSDTIGNQNVKSWLLACLGNNMRRQQEASAFAQKTLSKGPVNLSAVRWSLVRGWPIELDTIIENLCDDHPETDPAKTEVLVRCYLAVCKPEDALLVLEDAKQAFQKSDQTEAYSYWRAVCLSESGQTPQALAVLGSKNDDDPWLAVVRLSMLRGQEETSGELADLAVSTEKIWARTDDARLLLELCELRATLRDWTFVVEHGARLLTCIGTGVALLLYAMALHNVGRHEDCLEVLSANTELFPGQILPPQFLALRAASGRALGLIPKALADAEAAVTQDPSLQNVIRLLQLKQDRGDQAGFVVTGRTLLDMEEAPAEILIWLSRSVRGYDTQAARLFLENALTKDIPDELAASVLDLANSLLGADDPRTHKVLKQVLNLGEQGKGVIRLTSKSELDAFLKTRADQSRKAFELYASAQIPIHVLAHFLGQPVVSCLAFLSTQEWNRKPTDIIPPLLRSGRLPPQPPLNVRLKRVLLDTTALIVGEMLGVLDAAEQAFPLLVIPFHTVPSLMRAQDALETQLTQTHDPDSDSTSQVAKWRNALATLIERLRRGIGNDTYVLMSEFAVQPDEQDFGGDLDVRCLRGMLLFQTGDGDLLWSDDRYLNGHAVMGSARIVSTTEVLSLLREVGGLSDEKYYAALLCLREWRTLFLPLDPAEICYHVNKNNDTKSTGWQVLRRWVATSFLNGGKLQLGTRVPDVSEFRAFLDLYRAIEASVFQIWKDTSVSIEDRKRRARWILEELHVSALAMRRSTTLPRERENPLQLEALGLACLFTCAFGQLPHSEWQTYFTWIDQQFIAFRERNNPLLFRAIAENIADTLVTQKAWKRLGLGQKEKQLISFFVHKLPRRLRRFILEDQDVREELGFVPMVSVGEYSFDPGEFYAALEIAQNKGKADLNLLGEEQSVIIRALGDLPSQKFAIWDSEKEIPFVGEELVLLSSSAREREGFLREQRHWFDVSRSEFEQQVKSIAADPSPRRRVEKACAKKESSTSIFYSKIGTLLRRKERVELSEFIPRDLRSTTHFFGLSKVTADHEAFRAAYEQAIVDSLEEESLSTAFKRFRGIPVQLPDAVFSYWEGINTEERRQVLKEALRMPPSLLSQFHLLRLLGHSAADSPSIARLARRLVARLLSEEARQDAAMFLSILAWVENEFSWNQDLRSYPRAVQLGLAWGHTDALHSLFLEAGGDPNKIGRLFAGARSVYIPRDIFTRNQVHGSDIALAQRLSVETFLLSGLAYGLGDSKVSILNDNLLNSMLGVLFQDIDGIPTTRSSFLQDRRGFSNCMDSFLGGSWSDKLLPFFGKDVANMWSQDTANRKIKKSLETITTEGEKKMRAWLTLQAVVGDLPISDEWSGDLRSCLTLTDYPTLVEQDIENGMLAFYFACGQARHLVDDGLLNRLAGAVSGIVAQLPDSDPIHGSSLAGLLFDAIISLAVAEERFADAAATAVDLVRRAKAIRPDLAAAWEPAIWRLANRLPLEQGQEFWPLLLEIRAIA